MNPMFHQFRILVPRIKVFFTSPLQSPYFFIPRSPLFYFICANLSCISIHGSYVIFFFWSFPYFLSPNAFLPLWSHSTFIVRACIWSLPHCNLVLSDNDLFTDLFPWTRHHSRYWGRDELDTNPALKELTV